MVGQSRENFDSAEVFFSALLVFFAADAERRFGACFEAFWRDFFLARLAHAEGAVFDFDEGLVDLIEEDFFASAEAKREGLKVFARREVHFIRQITGIEGHVLGQRLLGFFQDLVAFLFQQTLEPLELRLVHVALPST